MVGRRGGKGCELSGGGMAEACNLFLRRERNGGGELEARIG